MTDKNDISEKMLPNHPTRDAIRLENIFVGLGNPVRLAALRRVAQSDAVLCCDILPGIPKSTMTHHWRILRDSGLIWQQRVGRQFRLSLRRDDLDARFPGLLEAVLKPLTEDALTIEMMNQYKS